MVLFVGRDRRARRRHGRSPHRAAALPGAVVAAAAHEVRQHLDRQREDDGRVLFGGDSVEGLEVAQLECRRRLVDDVGRLAQRLRCSVLAFRRNHLTTNQSISVNRGVETRPADPSTAGPIIQPKKNDSREKVLKLVPPDVRL